MNRDEIIEALKTATHDVLTFSGEYEVTGKWNYEAQVVHLTKCLSPLSTGLRLPVFIFRWKFGKPNRPVRTYEELVAKYQEKLENFEGANPQFAPNVNQPIPRDTALDNYKKESEKLYKAIETWDERQLDNFLLPHPLLGKVMIREMLYFTIYHTQHHFQILKRGT